MSSGIDPLAALALSNEALIAAETAFIEAALDLGLPADVVQAQISVGDLLSGTVLPPQNGNDFIELFGRAIPAQLPPNVRPGETLLLQVTGFAANRIVVRNLGLNDPQNPVPTVQIELPEPPAPTQPQTPQSGQRTQTPPQPAAQTRPVPASPPRELFIAASVRQAAAMPAPARTQVAVRNVTATVQRVIRTAGDLLKALRVPDTPFTRTAAAIAPQAPARLPIVLQRLEAALPRESSDPRVATLRTLLAFTSHIDPANEETLPAQISSYISHVVEGAEPKLQQLLQAHAAAPAPAQPQPQAAVSGQVREEPAAQSTAPSPLTQGVAEPRTDPHAPAVPQHIAQAHVAQRTAAFEHDLKSLVLSLLRDPPAARMPTLTQALNETVITLTGTQINTLSAATQDPVTISFALPVHYHEGGKPAYVRISREAQGRAAKLDADNFHVAFVLDTANLGTVAIDVESTGRAVKVNVKTERQAAASRFADTFASLRSRLEDLRYRVTSVTANALATKAEAAPPARRNGGNGNGLDLRA